MDRTIVYSGAIPLDTDLLYPQRSTMIALGYLAQATLGSNVIADGLACTPTVPASLSVNIGPGSITQLAVIDNTAFGSLPADTMDPLLKMGINTGATTLTLTAPTTSGQAITYLVEAAMAESDSGAVLLPYYNASNPAVPYSGPNNDGLAQNTARTQSVQLQLKAGAPGLAGAQPTPNADPGWVGLYTIAVAAGQTAITATNIATLPTAPFLQWKLPQLKPGSSTLQSFTPATQGYWSVPAGVGVLKVRVWGGGGAGGSGFGGAGGGGAGGGYAEGYLSVTPGQSIHVTVGAGGTGTGGAGGTSSFGTLASATGGSAGGSGGTGAVGSGGASAGAGAGATLLASGQTGAPGFQLTGGWLSGGGGGAFGGSGANGGAAVSGTNANGANGTLPGCGGAGGIGTGTGGSGGAGLVLIEW